MISVDEAIAQILDGAQTLDAEAISLGDVSGRVLAEDVVARISQPPFAASAMDGYAVRFCDMAPGAQLSVVGEAPAGAPYDGTVASGEAVRILTGGAVPSGADHVIMQEDVTREGERITINAPQKKPRNIRQAGIDFHQDDILAKKTARLHDFHGSIFAAANVASVSVTRRPRVAIFSNGDELVEPGATLGPGEIVNSNHIALSAMVKSWGGAADYLGCAADSEDAIAEFFKRARDADIIIPIGGASVGDYDFVKSAFHRAGGETRFEKIAVRPGKPTWFGKFGHARIVGLPGNPASALVTAALFVQPLVRRLAATQSDAPHFSNAILTQTIAANGARETYLRASAEQGDDGAMLVTPAPSQDSSLLTPFASANVLIRRKVNAPAVASGGDVEIVRLR
ncbi:MAG: molybdopterin molybdotransferase MoeA [Alphaproteobacteria bacterium]|nr:molybdopterin molybdotransferase MoeA [Alphaproteobacteria bacterium]